MTARDTVLQVVTDEMIRAWAVCRRMQGRSISFCSVNSLHPAFGHIGRGNEPPVQGLLDADRVQEILIAMPESLRDVFEAHYLTEQHNGWRSLGMSRRTWYRRLEQARAFIRDRIDTWHYSGKMSAS